MFLLIKLKLVGEKLWNSGSKQVDMLEKKKKVKIQNRKKMINQIKEVCILARTETVIWQQIWKIYHN